MKEKQSISIKLRRVNDKIRQVSDAAFSEYNLTGPQVGYIGYILDEGGAIPQNELEKKARVSHPTIVGVVNRLQEKGYVEILMDKKDRRKRIIRLTDSAENVLQQLKKKYAEMSSALLKGLSNEEIKELDRLLQKLDDNVSVSLSGKGEESDEKQVNR